MFVQGADMYRVMVLDCVRANANALEILTWALDLLVFLSYDKE